MLFGVGVASDYDDVTVQRRVDPVGLGKQGGSPVECVAIDHRGLVEPHVADRGEVEALDAGVAVCNVQVCQERFGVMFFGLGELDDVDRLSQPWTRGRPPAARAYRP
jgi:hypothetical protein